MLFPATVPSFSLKKTEVDNLDLILYLLFYGEFRRKKTMQMREKLSSFVETGLITHTRMTKNLVVTRQRKH